MLREIIAKLSAKDREKLHMAFEAGTSYCVPFGDKYVVGVNLNRELFKIIEESGVWMVGETE